MYTYVSCPNNWSRRNGAQWVTAPNDERMHYTEKREKRT